MKSAIMAALVAAAGLTQSGCLVTMGGRAVQRHLDRKAQASHTQRTTGESAPVSIDARPDGAGGVQWTAGIEPMRILRAWTTGAADAPFWSWPTVVTGIGETIFWGIVGEKNGVWDDITGSGSGSRQQAVPSIQVDQQTGQGDNVVVFVFGAGSGTSTSSGHNAPFEGGE
jgi:hypothetical protein